MKITKKFFEVFRALIAAYVLTGLVLAVMALLVFKFEVGEQAVNIGIIVTYIISTLLGGFIAGKKIKEKKFIWGIVLGLTYMVIILAASIVVNQNLEVVSVSTITTMAMCVGGGMLGGMLS